MQEHPLGRGVRAEGLEPVHHRVPGALVSGQLLGERGQPVDVLAVDGLEQVEAVREVPVQGADADAGPAGDLLERRVTAQLGERLAGALDQPVVVALGVGPQRSARGSLRAVAGAPLVMALNPFELLGLISTGRNSLANRRMPPYSNRRAHPLHPELYLKEQVSVPLHTSPESRLDNRPGGSRSGPPARQVRRSTPHRSTPPGRTRAQPPPGPPACCSPSSSSPS